MSDELGLQFEEFLYSHRQLPAAKNWRDHVPGAMKKLICGAQQKENLAYL